MNWTPTEFEGRRCPKWIKEQLDKMVRVSTEIGCMKYPSIFFNNFYIKYLREKINYRATEEFDPRTRPFLEAECSIMDAMFRKITSRFLRIEPPVLRDIGNIENIDEITDNDILFIRCPTIFAGYHFIFAVVNKKGTFVDVYQAYGARPLYRIQKIPIENFKNHLKFLKDIRSFPQEQAIPSMVFIEENLYQTDIYKKFKDYFDELNRNIEEGAIEDDETDPRTVEEYITFYFGENITKTENNFSIQCLKFVRSDCQTTGGKSRKRKVKKSKRTRRYH